MSDGGDSDDGDGTVYHFGHAVYLADLGRDNLRYVDTDEPVPRGPSKRPCPRCGELPTSEGHDPCIANLPGVTYACCGHGVTDGYVEFETGHVIRGEFDTLLLNWGAIGRIRSKLRSSPK